jgi:hypothetical protein
MEVLSGCGERSRNHKKSDASENHLWICLNGHFISGMFWVPILGQPGRLDPPNTMLGAAQQREAKGDPGDQKNQVFGVENTMIW